LIVSICHGSYGIVDEWIEKHYKKKTSNVLACCDAESIGCAGEIGESMDMDSQDVIELS